MRRLGAFGLLFAGVGLGCVVRDVYFDRAEAVPTKSRWEYRCISDGDTTSLSDVVAQLNKAGAEGWELAVAGNRTTTTSHYCLKRPF